jgi:hypothetical protein
MPWWWIKRPTSLTSPRAESEEGPYSTLSQVCVICHFHLFTINTCSGYGDDALSPAEESSPKRVKSTLLNSGQTSSGNILETPDSSVSTGSVLVEPASAQTPNSNNASGSETLVVKTKKGKKKKGKKL